MSSSDNVLIYKGVHLNYDRLCLAVRQTAQPHNPTPAQLEALAELQACRAQIASPLNPHNERAPSQQDRSRLTTSSGITILVNPDTTSPDSDSLPICLGSDLVSVAVALSDELRINEVDAAILLYDARARAARRSDHDVVVAAKEVFVARRRESLLYIQQIIRAGLNYADEIIQVDTFMSSLLKERDLLLTDHQVFQNIVDRLNNALEVLSNQQISRFRYLAASEERLLLAETLFLLAYTVQLNPTEAGSLYTLLLRAQKATDTFCKAHNFDSQEPTQAPKFQSSNLSGATDSHVRLRAVDVVRLKSVRNLLFLAWTAALDRSRYHNIYNPRTGQTGVNELLKDSAFARSTSHVPRLIEGEEDKIASVGSVLAATELSGALFRLAVALPDESEAVTTFLRASAYGSAFAYLSEELIQWIQHGAGSLSPDTDLYADVVEDLALDIAEAPRLVAALIQFAQNETSELAANFALESLRSVNIGRAPERSLMTLGPGSPDSKGRLDDRSAAGVDLSGSASMRPPAHPRSRRGSRMMMRPVPNDGTSGALRSKMEDSLRRSHQGKAPRTVDELGRISAASLVSLLARFVARAVGAAPAKLQCDSVGGGMRYWVGIGQSSIGFIPRVGDAVIDMWDTTMRNANAPGSVGVAFQRTLQGFLLLLKATSQRQGSPAHAAASLKYLRHGGHPVASLERATGAVSYIADSFSVSGSDIQLDDAEAKALCGILDVISTAAEALESHGGVVSILEDSGRELVSRLSSLVILNIPLQLRESAIKCLGALNYSRTVPVLLETLSAEKCAALRHWVRVEEAPSKSFSVTTSILGLVKRCLHGADSCSEKTLEAVATSYIIDELLSFWNRRAYSVAAQRWELVATASEILVELLTKNSSNSLSQQIATSLLQPAPGTGSASYGFQALCLSAGLVRREEQMLTENWKSLHMSLESGNIISGRMLLTHVVRLGQGDSFRWMRKAVFHSSRLLSLLLMVSPGRLSKSGVVTASAVDLLASEPECLTSASSLVHAADGFDHFLSRAGYGFHFSATVLSMLGKAALSSGVVASILTKDLPASGSSGSASQFRASLSRILLDAPASTGELHREVTDGTTEGVHHVLLEDPVLHSVLRIVEACLGPDGCAAPGMFLLGIPTDALGRHSATEHGVLGALIELVAGVSLYQPFDDPSRSTAATFLERLVSHTAKNTSSAVLDHIRSISEADSSVRGGGFADEMLLRAIEDMHGDGKGPTTEFDWSSFATFLSACMKLSALQVRLFPEHEKRVCDMSVRTEDSAYSAETSSYVDWSFSNFPSPLALIELLSRAAETGDQSSVSDAFGAWSNLMGMRLSVHTEGKGYADETVLFDLVMKLLSALSADSREHGFEALVVVNYGETACATILDCVAKLTKCYESRAQENTQAITEYQFLTIIDGICRGLVSLSRAGSRSERARTFLYGTLLSCCLLSRAEVSTNMLSRALCKRSSGIGGVEVDTLMDVACSDALLGNSTASKSASISLISRLVACEPSRTLQALAAQNRFRRIIATSFSYVMGLSASEHSSSRLSKNPGEDGHGAPVARAVLSLIHAVSVTASGGRLLADAGCIETLGQVFASYESGSARKQIRRSATSYVSAAELDVSLDSLRVPSTFGSGILETWQSALFSSLTGALAVAVRCGGENVVEDVVYAIDKGRSVFLEMLRNLDLPDEVELNAVSALGMALSRIPSHLVSAAVTCSQLRSNLACVFGRILPPVTKTQRLGESGSFLSAGINLKHPATTRATRRVRVVHPEGGSLHERDIVRARSAALRNIFSTFIQQNALPFLFAPNLVVSRPEYDTAIPGRNSYASGSLSEVLRIAQAMLREYNRSTNESIHLGRQAAGDVRPSVSSSTETELHQFCEEEYSAQREGLDQSQIKDCLKKESLSVSNHAAVCMRVLEMALIILREYIYNAVDTVRGKPTSRGEGRDDGKEGYERTWHEMSVDKASSLLADANHTVVPFCKDVENVQDGFDDTIGTFSRQVCRQIRAACPA